MKIIIIFISCLWMQAICAQYYQCISNAFNSTCKTKLYACTNNPDCSYQLHENTKHIFLYQNSEEFPSLYFSNPIARDLYECLKNTCSLPNIDQNYPKTLPLDYCMMQVYDICKGDIDYLYQNQKVVTPQIECYKKYCSFPQLQNTIQ